MEPAEVKDVIDEAIERAEEEHERDERAERAAETGFRNRVAILVGVFAVLLAITHVGAAGAARDAVDRNIQASDTFAYMQAKIVRETVLTTGADAGGVAPERRVALTAEARRLRNPDRAGHGIGQLQSEGDRLRHEAEEAARRGERYELAETALQVAIVLLSIALVARSRPIVGGAVLLALLGAAAALLTRLGLI